MQQLRLFPDEPAPKPRLKKLTRNRLARLDYEAPCPLPFIEARGYCHNCVLFAGGEIDLSVSPPRATLRCRANELDGRNVGFRPGHIHIGWRSVVAWVKEVVAG